MIDSESLTNVIIKLVHGNLSFFHGSQFQFFNLKWTQFGNHNIKSKKSIGVFFKFESNLMLSFSKCLIITQQKSKSIRVDRVAIFDDYLSSSGSGG